MTKAPLLIASLVVLVSSANAQLTFAVKNFASAGVQDGDRSFVKTSFVGSSYEMNTSNMGFFGDGTLHTNGNTYGWTSNIPGDFGGGNDYALNPDRGINATPFAGESNTVKSGTLKEVFGQNNLGYLLDGEDNRTWTLDLMYRNNGFITADGLANTPELMMMERGANSKLGIRAILGAGQFSNSFVLDFGTSGSGQAGLTDYTLHSTEIGNAQVVSGLGLSLDALGVSKGTKVYGYQFYVDQNSGTDWSGPDFVGFVAGRTAPVPEPASLTALGLGLLGMLRRKKRSSSAS